MPDKNLTSIVFLATPTSGTGSLWRIISILADGKWNLCKIAEEYANRNALKDLPNWQPEPNNNIYMYNTPHIINEHLVNTEIKLIVNFRDPRDMACNQFHWVFQHPDHTKTEEQLRVRREQVKAQGIDEYVKGVDNNLHFASFKFLKSRLREPKEHTLLLSYSQLCLDFDNLVERTAQFLGIEKSNIPWEKLEAERTSNIANNPSWIGNTWTGADTSPGRYLKELNTETIDFLDQKYSQSLSLLMPLESPQFRKFLTTKSDREEEKKVLIGKEGFLFLQNDSNHVIQQITGNYPIDDLELEYISLLHRDRKMLCAGAGNIHYEHVVIPCKEVAAREFLPSSLVFEGNGRRPISQYQGNGYLMRIHDFFYSSSLLDAKQHYPKGDTHWNHDGAFLYFSEFLKTKLPEEFEALNSIIFRRFESFQQSDLARKIYLDPEKIHIIAPSNPTAHLAFENKIPNEGSIRRFLNTSEKATKRCLVIHDSFTMWLFNIIAELFHETLFFHGTIFDIEFIRQYKPDIILCLQTERFFPRVPSNSSDMFQFVREQESLKSSSSPFENYFHNEMNP